MKTILICVLFLGLLPLKQGVTGETVTLSQALKGLSVIDELVDISLSDEKVSQKLKPVPIPTVSEGKLPNGFYESLVLVNHLVQAQLKNDDSIKFLNALTVDQINQNRHITWDSSGLSKFGNVSADEKKMLGHLSLISLLLRNHRGDASAKGDLKQYADLRDQLRAIKHDLGAE